MTYNYLKSNNDYSIKSTTKSTINFYRSGNIVFVNGFMQCANQTVDTIWEYGITIPEGFRPYNTVIFVAATYHYIDGKTYWYQPGYIIFDINGQIRYLFKQNSGYVTTELHVSISYIAA